jgi:hypothetical protein
MNKALLLLLSFLCFPSEGNASEGLINLPYIREHLTSNCGWAKLHGAQEDDLGAGMLYYGIVYSMKAKTCVCLGSGDGFVPRVLRQAQRDLKLEDSHTILIDGNIGKWGRPLWLSENSIIKREFPEIEIILKKTSEAYQDLQGLTIDYLHIDADRTVKGALQDFLDYLPFMADGGVIILHDSGPKAPCAGVVNEIKKLGYCVINFEHLGAGAALIMINHHK